MTHNNSNYTGNDQSAMQKCQIHVKIIMVRLPYWNNDNYNDSNLTTGYMALQKSSGYITLAK